MAKQQQSKVETLYHRHAHLAEYYATKIFNEGNISMEREDVEQELRLKLWTSIKTYLEKWGRWREGKDVKPIPLPFYLKTAMINRSKDFIKEINRVQNVPMSSMDFDYGREDFPIEVDFENKRIMVGCTDLLESIPKEEKKFFMLYFKGLSISKINKIYKGALNPKMCMKINMEKIREIAPLLVEEVTEYRVFSHEE